MVDIVYLKIMTVFRYRLIEDILFFHKNTWKLMMMFFESIDITGYFCVVNCYNW